MAEIWIWNSMATRKRSPSDGFLENGLGILKSYLESQNHSVRIIDWQDYKFHQKLCFGWLLALNKRSVKFIFKLGEKNRNLAKAYFPVFNLIQDAVHYTQKSRMQYYLRKLGDDIIRNKIKVAGVKVWYGEAFVFSNYLAAYLKRKDPSILLIAGGFHVTLYEEDFLKNSVFDLGVAAEGEQTLETILDIVNQNQNDWHKEQVLEIVKSKIQKGELKNLIYRDNGIVKVTERNPVDLKQKSFPSYDEATLTEKLRIHAILDSLGCPWGKCNFCVHHHFYSQFQARPVADIVAELKYVVAKGVGMFRFAGSETPPGFGVRIAEEILANKLEIMYSIGCRPIKGIGDSENVYIQTVDNFKIMLKAGLRAIFFGGESGNDVINDVVMNKGVNRKEITKTIEAFKQAQKETGIKAYSSLALIYPTPLVEGITLEKVFKDNLDLIQEVHPDSVIISPCTPFKNSKWYEEKEKYGFEFSDGLLSKFMNYEYVLYKPPSLWPSLGNVKFQGLSFQEFLLECERLRKAVDAMGISTDLTDEYYMMIIGAGYSGEAGIKEFKKATGIDLISSEYSNIKAIAAKTNEYSKKLAASNKTDLGLSRTE
jgi:radical SAM superfamily enzyme YgiQ (UPF0313 family)